MKDSTVEAIFYFIFLLLFVVPLASYCVMFTWNDVLVDLAGFKVIGFWGSVRVTTAVGISASLFSNNRPQK